MDSCQADSHLLPSFCLFCRRLSLTNLHLLPLVWAPDDTILLFTHSLVTAPGLFVVARRLHLLKKAWKNWGGGGGGGSLMWSSSLQEQQPLLPYLSVSWWTFFTSICTETTYVEAEDWSWFFLGRSGNCPINGRMWPHRVEPTGGRQQKPQTGNGSLCAVIWLLAGLKERQRENVYYNMVLSPPKESVEDDISKSLKLEHETSPFIIGGQDSWSLRDTTP